MIIDILTSDIRDWINSPNNHKKLRKNHDQFNGICSSLDVIGDTELAIDYFLKINSFDARKVGKSYILVYGIFQALYLQQDAVVYLYKLFVGEDVEYKDYKLDKVREYRNNITGHPVERRFTKFAHVINRGEISREGIKILKYEGIDNNMEYIKFDEIIKTQNEGVIKMLQKIKDNLGKNK